MIKKGRFLNFAAFVIIQKIQTVCRNTEKCVSHLSSSDWNHVYSSTDPNIALNHFVDTFTYYHDLCFPLITSKVKTHPDKKMGITYFSTVHKLKIKTLQNMD